MTSYRFCRPDDMHLLVKAINSCVAPYSTGEAPPFTAEDYKTMAQEQDLWSSSCMIASEKDDFDVIAAIIGCKRDEETLIWGVGARQDTDFNDYVPEMLESLKRKLSILGPPKITAEVNTASPELCNLFQQGGYEPSNEVSDYSISPAELNDGSKQTSVPIEEISIDDVKSMGMLSDDEGTSWIRQLKTLENCRDQLTGLAIVSAEALESFLFYREYKETRELLALDYTRSEVFLTALLKSFTTLQNKIVFVPKIASGAVNSFDFTSVGFNQEKKYVRYKTIASAEQSLTQFQPHTSKQDPASYTK